ncbi:globin domain-containing protein [Jhaorihella thermophila]|uniref:globin domain-containing protein n=1 Tax=Jhaorihella thermophila TaxID=488547 RepID=UPI0036183874
MPQFDSAQDAAALSRLSCPRTVAATRGGWERRDRPACQSLFQTRNSPSSNRPSPWPVPKSFSPSQRCFTKLFERDPNLRALFREDIAGQGMRFMRTLRTIVTALRQLGGAQEVLEPLARTHGALGVHAQHFETMGEALIDTFKELLGPDFTPEMEAAWRKAYREIADAMIEAGKID